MRSTILCVVTAAALTSLGAPAQAKMFDGGLESGTSTAIHQARYWGHYRDDWRRHYAWSPYHRHHRCWHERARVRVPGGFFVWRTHRRCAWRHW